MKDSRKRQLSVSTRKPLSIKKNVETRHVTCVKKLMKLFRLFGRFLLHFFLFFFGRKTRLRVSLLLL